MRIVHAADLHIDSPLQGLERYPGAPVERVRSATRAAFSRVIDLCLEERAKFLVLAGDVFDGDWKDAHTGLFFVQQLARLHDVGCRVLLLLGNHDFALTQNLRLRFPPHVFTFDAAGARDGKHTFVFEDEGIAFHGLSYPRRHVEESLVDRYPACISGLINVGVLHTSASGSKGAAQHATYAPCAIEDLVRKGYDYWALGHVHTHEVLHRDPFVVYPGNTQGRHVKESGDKGCVLVETEGARVASIAFKPTAVMHWFSETIDLGEDDDVEALHAAVQARLAEVASRASTAAVRLVVRGGCRAHAEITADPSKVIDQIRVDAMNDHRDALWVEKVELETTPRISLEELRASSDLVADLLRHAARLRDDDADAERNTLAHALEPLKKKLDRELKELQLDLGDRTFVEDCVQRAEAWLAQRLAPARDEDEAP